MPTCFRPLLLLSSLLIAACPAGAQPGLPSGADEVVIGRLFHRGPAGTIAVARFGLVLPKKGSGRAALDVPARADDPVAGYVLDLSAERRRGAARLSWSLQPAGAAGLPASSGSQEILAGVLGHLSIAESGGTRIYASVETGRASSFDALKLARHFGVALGGPSAPPAPRPMAPAPVAPAAPRAQVVAPRAPTPQAPQGGGAILNLSFRVEQDGELVFAPRVRVREHQAFAVKGGELLDAAGERWDGLELSGLARLQGGSCLLDLAVQSGRRVSAGGTETWLVDRYRRDVLVGLGLESSLPLFEDIEGSSAWSLGLTLSCESE